MVPRQKLTTRCERLQGGLVMSKVIGKQRQFHRTINLGRLGAHLTDNRQL